MINPLLFVYGTLRRDVRDGEFHRIAGQARFVGRGRVRGELLDLGEYPGMVPSTDPEAWVHGDVFELDPAEEVLGRLDEYEGCGPEEPEPHEFRRAEEDVALESGETVRAWIYLYHGDPHGKGRISSGDYLLS